MKLKEFASYPRSWTIGLIANLIKCNRKDLRFSVTTNLIILPRNKTGFVKPTELHPPNQIAPHSSSIGVFPDGGQIIVRAQEGCNHPTENDNLIKLFRQVAALSYQLHLKPTGVELSAFP